MSRAQARAQVARMSTEEGDYWARMLLAVCQEVQRRQWGIGPESTGVYVDADVRDRVMRSAA